MNLNCSSPGNKTVENPRLDSSKWTKLALLEKQDQESFLLMLQLEKAKLLALLLRFI